MRGWTIAAVCGLTLTSGCSGADTLHCSDGNPPTQCIEASGFDDNLFGVGLRTSVAVLCQVVGASPTDGACPEDGKLAGCEGDEQGEYTYVEWTYEGGDETSPDDVTCGSDEVKVLPEGAVDTDTDADTDA